MPLCGIVVGLSAPLLPVLAERLDRLREILRTREHRPEEIAETSEARGHVLDREVRRAQVALELVPGERRRDRGAAHRTHDVRRHDGLALPVLAEVDVDLAAALRERALDRRDLGEVA